MCQTTRKPSAILEVNTCLIGSGGHCKPHLLPPQLLRCDDFGLMGTSGFVVSSTKMPDAVSKPFRGIHGPSSVGWSKHPMPCIRVSWRELPEFKHRQAGLSLCRKPSAPEAQQPKVPHAMIASAGGRSQCQHAIERLCLARDHGLLSHRAHDCFQHGFWPKGRGMEASKPSRGLLSCQLVQAAQACLLRPRVMASYGIARAPTVPTQAGLSLLFQHAVEKLLLARDDGLLNHRAHNCSRYDL